MTYRDKHNTKNKLKIYAGGTIAALTIVGAVVYTVSPSKPSVAGAKVEEFKGGMLGSNTLNGKDFYNNDVTMEHVKFNVYKSKNSTEPNRKQLAWGVKLPPEFDVRDNAATHLEKVKISSLSEGFVLVDNDGVLKDAPCFMVYKDSIVLIGDARTYAENKMSLLQEKKNLNAQIRKKDILPEDDKVNIKKQNNETNDVKSDSVKIQANDTIFNPHPRDSVQSNTYSSQDFMETLFRMQNNKENG